MHSGKQGICRGVGMNVGWQRGRDVAVQVGCDVFATRRLVEQGFRGLSAGDFFHLREHWSVVIRGLFLYTRSRKHFTPADVKVVCVDVLYVGNGGVVGEGLNILHIAKQIANHFVPLFPAVSRGGLAGSAEVSERPPVKGVICFDGVREDHVVPLQHLPADWWVVCRFQRVWQLMLLQDARAHRTACPVQLQHLPVH